MQFLPLSAMLTLPPPPPPLPPLRHFRTLYPMHTTLSILLCHPFPSIILSPFIFATIQTVGTPPRREKGGRRRVVREGRRGQGGHGKTKKRGREKNQLRGRNEQGATSGRRRGDGFRGMRSGASGNDEREDGGVTLFFCAPARVRYWFFLFYN